MTYAYIVDDREVDRYTARRRLAKSGKFTIVHEAEDGRIFLEQMAQCPQVPDAKAPLVLMDISMPYMDGFETVAALKAQMVKNGWPEDVVVVMVSSSNAAEDRRRASELPLIEGYFEKPIQATDVETMLAMLAKRSGEQPAPVGG